MPSLEPFSVIALKDLARINEKQFEYKIRRKKTFRILNFRRREEFMEQTFSIWTVESG